MIIILRGHIRNSFHNRFLYDFIRNLYESNNNIDIYIHTWNIVQSKLSWRQINQIDYNVDETMIKEYFGELSFLIKHIIIDDDKKIKLIGKKRGFISGTTCPVKAWKNYWYGKFKVIDYVKSLEISNNCTVLNFRFDVFCNPNLFSPHHIYDFVIKNINNEFNENLFVNDKFFLGCDNFYMGNIETMYKLTYHFHFNLDKIISNIPVITHQEGLVMVENCKLFETKKNIITHYDIIKYTQQNKKMRSFNFLNYSLSKII